MAHAVPRSLLSRLALGVALVLALAINACALPHDHAGSVHGGGADAHRATDGAAPADAVPGGDHHDDVMTLVRVLPADRYEAIMALVREAQLGEPAAPPPAGAPAPPAAAPGHRH